MWNWKAFPNVVTILPSYQPCTRVLVALHFSDNAWWCQFNFSPVGACGMVPHCGSICMSLMTKTLNIFSCACWPIPHRLLWSVCSNLLAILKLIVSQDGRGIGRGDHFLFYKFIERTTERWTKFTKQLWSLAADIRRPEKQPIVFKGR